MHPVTILSLATRVPPHVLHQADVAERTRRIFPRLFERFSGLNDIFTNAGIERRYSVRPIEWFDEPHDWSDRTRAYLEGADALYSAVAQDALERAGLSAGNVDTIVSVSSTGIATPSLDARVAQRLGFRPDAHRVPVFGLGCAGGVSGLSIAARLARADPGTKILIVVLELCTLAFRPDRNDKADVITTALFGDGAAALVLRADDDRGVVTLKAAREHTWPETLDIMGWSVDPAGFGVVLSRSLPQFVAQHLAAPTRRFADDCGLSGNHRHVFHPGGARVLDAVEESLDLASGALAQERAVLRDYGNMSAPTVLFVLERALREGWQGDGVMAALGPGFTASFLQFATAAGAA